MHKKLSAAACLLLLSTAYSAIEYKEFKNGDTQCLRIISDFYEIVIVPDYGGRVFYWHDKLSDVDFINAQIPQSRNDKINLTGMLDDRADFTAAPYQYAVSQPDPNTLILVFNAVSEQSQLAIRRRMTFKSDSPVINVKYRYENRSHENIAGFGLGIRNFIYPSGDGVSADDRYYFPSTHTLRRIKGYDFKDESGRLMPEMQTKLYYNIGAPWNAMLNLPRKCGFAISFEDDSYSGWYVWKRNVKYPTYEWTFRDLHAGHARDTEFNIIQLDGMEGLAYASSDLLADTKLKLDGNNLTVDTLLRPLQKQPDLKLNYYVSAIGSRWSAKKVECDIGQAAKFSNQTTNASFKLPGNGLYEIRQQLKSGNTVIAEWTETLPVGPDTETVPVYQFVGRNISESTAIPGWQPPKPVQIDANVEDRERGFILAHPLEENRYRRFEKLELAIAANEYESSEIIMVPLDYYGGVKWSLKTPPEGAARLRVRIDEVLDHRKGGASRPRRPQILHDLDNITLETASSLWLTVGSGCMKPGNYDFEIIVESSKGRAILPVCLKVHDFKITERRLVHLEAEGYPMSFPDSNQPEILKKWYENMASHGIDFFQYIGHMKAKKLDYQSLDYYIDRALAHGLTIFKAARYDLSEPTEQERKNWQDLSRYLRAKGFQNKDLFVKILDEQPYQKYPGMANIGRWLKQAGFRPFSTFHNLMDKPERLKLLEGVFDMYQGGFTTREDSLARLKDGTLKKDDLLFLYTGGGTASQPYQAMVFWGVQTGALEHPMFHNHEYNRGGNARLGANIVMVSTENTPLDSAAFEGLRDGMDIANLAAMFRQWRALLPNSAVMSKLNQRFEKIFDGPEAIFKVTKKRELGVTKEVLTPFTFEQYTMAHNQLLEILAELKPLTGIEHASITWNGKVIFDHKQTFKISGDDAAIQHFLTVLSRHTGLSPERLQSGEKSLEIICKIGPASYSYSIEEQNGRIEFTAPTADNLKIGINNWVNTLDLQGIWQ